MKSKEILRTQYLALRRALTPLQVESLSLQVLEQVKHWLAEREELLHMHLFLPIAGHNEVNTLPIKELLEQEEKILYTSRIKKGELGLDTLRLPQKARFRNFLYGLRCAPITARDNLDRYKFLDNPSSQC